MQRRRQQPPHGQASLFDATSASPLAEKPHPVPPAKERAKSSARTWRMPEVQGRTVAEVRLRWLKRLTPAQVARVEAEISALPGRLTRLGFGTVEVERVFVQRRRK